MRFLLWPTQRSQGRYIRTQTQKANKCVLVGPSVGTSDLKDLFYRFKFSQVEIQEMTGVLPRGISASMSRLGGWVGGVGWLGGEWYSLLRVTTLSFHMICPQSTRSSVCHEFWVGRLPRGHGWCRKLGRVFWSVPQAVCVLQSCTVPQAQNGVENKRVPGQVEHSSRFSGSVSVSGQLRTYPSPNPTVALTY